jgi:hypothetical protein
VRRSVPRRDRDRPGDRAGGARRTGAEAAATGHVLLAEAFPQHFADAETLPLPLPHSYGRLQCHDIVATDTHQYRSGFRAPAKYDGSVVNWVNGPLLARIGARKGFDVSFAPFRRNGSNIITMTADVRC